jgi:two-component system, cell cycle sensor histidine kinase and response regulator CckA
LAAIRAGLDAGDGLPVDSGVVPLTARMDPLRVLLVEDSEADALLIERQLRDQGFDPRIQRVQTEAELREALSGAWDVALADYTLPGFGGLRALALVKEHMPHVPVIVISGTVDDEELVVTMKSGAADYVLKEKLSRLGPAIRRELQDAGATRLRQEAERARREAEERFRFVVEHTGEVPYRLRFDTMSYDYISPGIERLTGFTPDEMTAGHFATRIVRVARPPQGSLPGQKMMAVGNGEKAQEFWADYLVRTKTGELRWFSDHSFPWLDEAGRVLGTVGVLADITERKRAEDALRRSEERYRQIVETAHEGVWLIDGAGNTTYANRRMADLLGVPADDMPGRSLYEFMDEEARPAVRARLEKRKAGLAEQLEFCFRRPDGSRLWALLSASPMFDENGTFTGALAMVADITERRLLEEQLLQSQKMEAVGRLAGGIAHDFNNLLGVILGHGDLLLRRIDEQGLRARLEQMVKAGERASVLTRQLLAFSRKQVLEPRVLDLNSLVTEMEKMLRRLIGEDIHLLTTVADGLGRVRADPGQLEQVLMNLVVNARDAMPTGGRLTIETANVELDGPYAAEHPGIRSGPHVMLAVSDTGIGMDPETRRQAFEPFFTTKPAGQGTGLGLATVYGIVKQSGGHIEVYSELGQGTSFKIYLPRVDQEAEAIVAVPKVPPARGSETVLLVEDEDALREIAAQILEEHGYTVLEARSGAAALERAESHAGPIHLLVADVVMPQMPGRELAERLAALRPSLRVLFMSGYTEQAVLRHGVLAEGTAFIQKPFGPDSFLTKVREVLEAAE